METETKKAGLLAPLLIVTLLFFAALGAGLFTARRLPVWIADSVERCLAREDFEGARRWAGRARDEALAAEYADACDYAEARFLAGRGKWEGASALYGSLGNYQDAPERKLLADYQIADALASAGRWEEAAEAFAALGAYGDSALRVTECRYRRAEALAEQGESYAAFELYESLGTYQDAADRMAAVAMAATGLEDKAEALDRFRSLSPEEVARRAELKELRDALPKDILDLGFYHTVGLRDDGTVLACGDNSFGQCDVAGWDGVTAVAAGGWHTVGLRDDGTVVCAGRNTENQCDTGDWRGITAVAASDYATFGLKSDGTVVFTGYQPDYFRDVPGWTGVTAITGGSYALGALRNNGEALISHPSARSAALKKLCGLAVNTGFAVGLNEDGTVVSPRLPLEDWRDVVAISCSGTGVAGLRADGTVVSRCFRPLDAPDVSAVRDAVAIAFGATHFAWCASDGSVHVTGDTSCGQGDTAQWRLF